MTLALESVSSEELDAIAEEIRQRMFDMGAVGQPDYRAEIRRQLVATEKLMDDEPISFTFTLHLIAQDVFQILGRARRRKAVL
jgi:hypothetical protein